MVSFSGTTEKSLNIKRKKREVDGSPRKKRSSKLFGHDDQDSAEVKGYIVQDYAQLPLIFKCYICDRDFFVQNGQVLYPGNEEMSILGSCRGLLCVAAAHGYRTMHIFNPSRENYEIKTIHNSAIPDSVTRPLIPFVGLGFDIQNSVFKIVRIFEHDDLQQARGEYQHLAEIYTVSERVWRRIDHMPTYVGIHSEGFYFNGSLYWVAEKHYENERCDTIVTFNLTDEQFGELEMPLIYLVDDGYVNLSPPVPCEIAGLLSLYCKTGTSARFWVMYEYGNSESWVEYIFAAPEDIDEAICVGWDGQVIYQDFEIDNNILIMNSLRNQEYQCCGFPVRYCGFPDACDVWTYTLEYVPY